MGIQLYLFQHSLTFTLTDESGLKSMEINIFVLREYMVGKQLKKGEYADF